MEYSLLCFSNLKILLIRTGPRTRLFGLWRFYYIATCVLPSLVCVCVCVLFLCFSSLCDFTCQVLAVLLRRWLLDESNLKVCVSARGLSLFIALPPFSPRLTANFFSFI